MAKACLRPPTVTRRAIAEPSGLPVTLHIRIRRIRAPVPMSCLQNRRVASAMPSAISRGRALRMVHCSWSGEVVLRPLRSVAAILISHSYRGYTR